MLSMILNMLCLTFENHQIRWIIIPLVTINVMDYFTFPEWSTKHLLSYYSVCMSSMTFLISQTFTSTKLSLSTLSLTSSVILVGFSSLFIRLIWHCLLQK